MYDWTNRDPAVLPLSKRTLKGFLKQAPEAGAEGGSQKHEPDAGAEAESEAMPATDPRANAALGGWVRTRMALYGHLLAALDGCS